MIANIYDYRGKRVHFIGIGGSSMSGLAGYLKQAGFTNIEVFADGRFEAPGPDEQRIYLKARKGTVK